MMYNDLLLNRGGGIIPDNIKVGMDNCAVINIGLGGTGIDCLAEVKKEVYSRISLKILIQRFRSIIILNF